MKKTIITIVSLVLIAGSVFWFANRNEQDDASEKNSIVTNEPSTAEAQDAVTITYTNDGFSPSRYQVGAGKEITVRNDSSSDLDFASDDHPTHTKNNELNLGVIAPGESKTVTLTETGSWGFHNHDNSSHAGAVNVQ